MGKRELFETPVIGFLLRAIGAFPVRRGEADRGALQMALAVVAAGQPLGFFVEGHRSESGQLIRGRPGVATKDPQAVTDAIMRRVAALLPPEQRGVYR